MNIRKLILFFFNVVGDCGEKLINDDDDTGAVGEVGLFKVVNNLPCLLFNTKFPINPRNSTLSFGCIPWAVINLTTSFGIDLRTSSANKSSGFSFNWFLKSLNRAN